MYATNGDELRRNVFKNRLDQTVVVDFVLDFVSYLGDVSVVSNGVLMCVGRK